MKKLIAMLLALVMMLGMVACGGGEETAQQGGNEGVDLAAKYGIDMEASGEQKMSDERVSKELLQEVRDVWLKRQISFAFDPDPKTYEDFVEYIGCDASYYSYNPKNGWRTFSWEADGYPETRFVAIFQDSGDGYFLYAASGQYL